MRKRFLKGLTLSLLLLPLLGADACSSKQDVARDAIAGAKGFIEAQQEVHLASCQADPAQSKCVAINKAVAAQNLAIDALQLYCGSKEFLEQGAACTPNKEFEPKLQEALRDLDTIVAQVKALLGSSSAQPASPPAERPEPEVQPRRSPDRNALLSSHNFNGGTFYERASTSGSGAVHLGRRPGVTLWQPEVCAVGGECSARRERDRECPPAAHHSRAVGGLAHPAEVVAAGTGRGAPFRPAPRLWVA